MRHLVLIISLLITISNLSAQDWERRHQFAKSYFGFNNIFVPSLQQGNFLNPQGEIQQFDRSNFMASAINIGATHFWGYADFYVAISLPATKFGKDARNNSFRFGTFTGLRIYPFPSKENTIRPFAGYKFSPFRYRQNDLAGENYKFTQVKSVFDLGLAIQLPNFYFTVAYSRVANPSFTTHLSRTVTSQDNFPTQLFQLGLNYTIETTSSADTEVNRILNNLFSSSNKDGLFLAVGPSSAFPLVSSNYISDLYPYLNDKSFPKIFPDLAIGYHFSKLDLLTALSFRPMNQKRSAYGFQQEINRKSIAAEISKFIGDYHGFAPFIGLGISYENLKLSEIDQATEITQLANNKIVPSLVFGWDIRPSAKGDSWILRTNLRYYPFLNIDHQGKKLSLQHLEFNFIQFVLYPQRMRRTKKK